MVHCVFICGYWGVFGYKNVTPPPPLAYFKQHTFPFSFLYKGNLYWFKEIGE